MKFTSSVAAALFLTSTLAQNVSAPFRLVIDSTNSTLHGKALFAGHEGAGVEGLLVGETLASINSSLAYYVYNLNYTATTASNSSDTGILTWELPAGNFNESEPMVLYPDPSTNVAIALFQPTENSQYVSFSADNKLYLTSYLNDLVTPPTDQTAFDLYRWHICDYNYEGYIYNVLCWIYGIYPPQNPSCQAVNVTRVFTT